MEKMTLATWATSCSVTKASPSGLDLLHLALGVHHPRGQAVVLRARPGATGHAGVAETARRGPLPEAAVVGLETGWQATHTPGARSQ